MGKEYYVFKKPEDLAQIKESDFTAVTEEFCGTYSGCYVLINSGEDIARNRLVHPHLYLNNKSYSFSYNGWSMIEDNHRDTIKNCWYDTMFLPLIEDSNGDRLDLKDVFYRFYNFKGDTRYGATPLQYYIELLKFFVHITERFRNVKQYEIFQNSIYFEYLLLADNLNICQCLIDFKYCQTVEYWSEKDVEEWFIHQYEFVQNLQKEHDRENYTINDIPLDLIVKIFEQINKRLIEENNK